ncbi:hypothetical protein BpHYR1_009401 [Brachionus plicatilis]|uniref:Uncharacterized protein n=1 Tax=Brachionus plicatilis TaxID=10195 RepID=A0A3M7RM09_BRAPC|nr:hypothetical protein BpHYR1_009401 [Brachionus plicatilis]
MDIGWKENNERLVKFGDESKIRVSRSDSVQAVVILVVGCLLVVSFFVYIAFSTKYLSKRLRIMNLLGTDRTKSSAQNVDADGDYLINGLYFFMISFSRQLTVYFRKERILPYDFSKNIFIITDKVQRYELHSHLCVTAHTTTTTNISQKLEAKELIKRRINLLRYLTTVDSL